MVQSFEPIPLYSTLEEIGFEHLTEKISDNEYRAYFYRTEEKEIATAMETPLHPAALANLGKNRQKHLARPRRSSGNLSGRRKILP